MMKETEDAENRGWNFNFKIIIHYNTILLNNSGFVHNV